MKHRKLSIFIICLAMLAGTSTAHAGKFGRWVKKAKKKVVKDGGKIGKKTFVYKGYKKLEQKAGWDRYILRWGDRDIPSPHRWVALRSALKRKKHTIGFFWDIKGDRQQCYGAGKKLQLWDITFQQWPQNDRRYRFIPVFDETRRREDYDCFWIQCGTGYYVRSNGKGRPLTLETRLPNLKTKTAVSDVFKWEIRNIGKNRFIFQNKKYGTPIDIAGKKSSKGARLITGTRNSGQSRQWEMIYIAEGNEKKSTKEIIVPKERLP